MAHIMTSKVADFFLTTQNMTCTTNTSLLDLAKNQVVEEQCIQTFTCYIQNALLNDLKFTLYPNTSKKKPDFSVTVKSN